MKKIMILIAMFILSATAFAQDNGMMNNRGYHNEYSNGNANGNTSFSTVEILLGAILLVLIIAVLMWFFDNNRKAKGYAGKI